MTERNPRILLLGTHGQHNIGDELLLETFLSQLGSGNHYVINTYDPADTAARLGARYEYDLIDTAGDRRALLSRLRKADMLVFAGGSILKELSAATGRNRYATLLMILTLVCAARWLTAAPVAMLNIGVGPIRTRRGRFLARRILNRVDLVTVRDTGSSELAARIGTRTRIVRSTDAVFCVTPSWLRAGAERALTARASLRAEAEPLRIGLSLNHDVEVPENWAHVLETLGCALRLLSGRRSIEVHGLPMQSRGKHHDDATILREFAADNADLTFVEHRPTTHADVARIIDGCDVVVAERLHALISAAKLGVPIVPLVYDVKVRELAAALGVADIAIDLGRRFTAEDLVDAIITAGAPRHAAVTAERVADLTDRARVGFEAARAWVQGRGQ